MPHKISAPNEAHDDAQRVDDLPASLFKNRLFHLPSLKIDPLIFQKRLNKNCTSYNCDSTCCKFGVWIDLKERDRILEHKDLIIRYMEDHQPKEPNSWFDETLEDDPDFPSGKTVGTRTDDRGCVFLMNDGRCVLQVAATQEGMQKYALKPFFCVAYPVVIAEGVLTLDDPEHANRPECCSYVEKGEERGIEVFREELEFVLGPEGFGELKERFELYRKKTENEPA